MSAQRENLESGYGVPEGGGRHGELIGEGLSKLLTVGYTLLALAAKADSQLASGVIDDLALHFIEKDQEAGEIVIVAVLTVGVVAERPADHLVEDAVKGPLNLAELSVLHEIPSASGILDCVTHIIRSSCRLEDCVHLLDGRGSKQAASEEVDPICGSPRVESHEDVRTVSHTDEHNGEEVNVQHLLNAFHHVLIKISSGCDVSVDGRRLGGIVLGTNDDGTFSCSTVALCHASLFVCVLPCITGRTVVVVVVPRADVATEALCQFLTVDEWWGENRTSHEIKVKSLSIYSLLQVV